MLMTPKENTFLYGEEDYVSLPVAAKYLAAKYDMTYGTVRNIVVTRNEIEYKRMGAGTRSRIRVQWGKVLEWERNTMVPASGSNTEPGQ